MGSDSSPSPPTTIQADEPRLRQGAGLSTERRLQRSGYTSSFQTFMRDARAPAGVAAPDDVEAPDSASKP